MSPDEPPIVTRGSLLALFSVMFASVTVIALSRDGSGGASATPDLARTLVAVERADGGLDMRDPGGALIDRFEIEGDLFAITAIRGVTGRIGQVDAAGDAYVLELRRLPGGSFRLHDPASGRDLPLEGFGADNRAALARYLTP